MSAVRTRALSVEESYPPKSPSASGFSAPIAIVPNEAPTLAMIRLWPRYNRVAGELIDVDAPITALGFGLVEPGGGE
jgi:hypothetical protein